MACALDLIIPAYNEAASIAATLDSLYSQTRKPDHIIVGDDLSTDDTARIALSKGAVVVSHRQRKGNKAFNQQAIIESSEFRSAIGGLDAADVALVIIDADTIFGQDGLEKQLVAALENDPDVVSASGYIIPQETTSTWQKARLVEYHLSMNLHKDVQDQLTGNLVASGCFVALSLSSVLNHGGFDTRTITEDFGLTCEQHIRKEKVRFVRDAVCYTKEPPTFTVLMKQLDRWYCGFFQNLKIHRQGITTAKNPGFSMMIAFVLIRSTPFRRDECRIGGCSIHSDPRRAAPEAAPGTITDLIRPGLIQHGKEEFFVVSDHLITSKLYYSLYDHRTLTY